MATGVILNRTQTAKHFGWHLSTLDHNLRSGLPGVKNGRDWKINSKDVVDWLIERAKSEASRNTKEVPDQDIRRRREVAEMERAERANALEAGEVCRIDEISPAWRGQVAGVCSRMDAVPPRFAMPIAYKVAASLGISEAQKIEDIRKLIEAQLALAMSEVRTELASGQTVPDIAGSEEETLPDAA